jgi:hypothetical protein
VTMLKILQALAVGFGGLGVLMAALALLGGA